MNEEQKELPFPENPVTVPSPSRSCGSCYACCVWLGIDELKKWPGQSCKHLTGNNGPEHRCDIYPSRPAACQKYRCCWIEGLGSDDMRPDKSGLLLTPYNSNLSSGPLFITIVVIDEAKAGTLTTGYLNQYIESLLKLGCDEIRVVNYKTKGRNVIHFLNGEVREGTLLKSSSYEEFICLTYDPPIAHYKIFSSDEDAKAWLKLNPQNNGSTRIISK